MGVDNGYGTGARRNTPASSTRPAAPRARRARGAAKPNTPLSQMSRAEYNARITQSQGARRVQQRRNDVSANALEAFTGFNRRDGVDAGDMLGLATAIPGGIARAVGRALIPTGARIAAAATRVSRRSRRVLGNAERAIQDADWNINQGVKERNFGNTRNQTVLGGNSNNYSFRGYGAFDENLGYDLTSREFGVGVREGEELVRRGLAVKDYSRGGDSWVYRPTGGDDFVRQGTSRIERGEAAKRAAEIAARTAADRVSTAASAREIRRRLTALRNAKEAEKKAPKQRDLSKPLDWNDL